MKKTAGYLTALFAACACATAAQAAPDCRSETAYVPDITELTQPIAPDRALGMVVGITPGSALHNTLRNAPVSAYGAILNDFAPASITFDPDTADKLTDIDRLPLIYVYGCLRNGASLIDAMNDLKKVDGIDAAAPDTKLYEVPVIPGNNGPKL